MGVISRKLVINRLKLITGHRHVFENNTENINITISLIDNKYVIKMNNNFIGAPKAKSTIERILDDLDSKHNLTQLQ